MRAGLLLVGMLFAVVALAAPITDAASATEAAKAWMKARCNERTPCRFKAERDGKQWRVWVTFMKRDAIGTTLSDRGGKVVMTFDAQGNLLRRLDTD